MASRMRHGGHHHDWIRHVRQRRAAAMTTVRRVVHTTPILSAPPHTSQAARCWLATTGMIPKTMSHDNSTGHNRIRTFASLPSSTTTTMTTTPASPPNMSLDYLEQETRVFLRSPQESNNKDDYWSSNDSDPKKKPSLFETGMKLMSGWRTRQHELLRLEHESKEDEDSSVVWQMQRHECAKQMESIMNVVVGVVVSSSKREVGEVVRPHVWTMEAWHMVGDGTAAARVLNAWGERYGGDISLAPTIVDFNLVLSCGGLSNDSPKEALDTIQLLLDTSIPSLEPNLESYSHVLHTHVHHYTQPPTPQQEQQQQQHNQSDNHMKEKEEQQQVIQRLFAQIEMLLLREDHPKSSFQPPGSSESSHQKAFLVARSYCDVIRAIQYSRDLNHHSSPDARKVDPGVVMDLLDRMEVHLFQKGVDVPLWNDNTTMTTVDDNEIPLLASLFPLTSAPNTKRSVSVSRLFLDAYYHAMLANRRGPPVKTIAEAVEKARGMESILTHMLQATEADDPETLFLRPQPRHYQIVMEEFANCFQDGLEGDVSLLKETAPHVKCMNVLKQMESHWLKRRDTHHQNDTSMTTTATPLPASMYHRVLWAWTQAICVLPSSGSSTSEEESGVEEAQRFFYRTCHLQTTGRVQRSSVKETTDAINGILNAWAMSSQQNAAQAAARFFRDCQTKLTGSRHSHVTFWPDPNTYAAVLTALCRHVGKDGKATAQAIQYAHTMLQQMKKTDVKPRAIHYAAVIHGWSRSTHWDAAKKAQALLLELEQAYQTSGYKGSLKPSIALYTAVVMAHASNGQPDSAEKAVALLKRVDGLYNSTGDEAYRPDVVFYGGVLTALARTPGDTSLKMAEALVEDLEWRAVNGEEHLRPNMVCYTSLIFKLVKSQQPERATEMFYRLKERYQASGDVADRPDATVYGVLLEGWARSGKEHGANEVERIISEMEALQASTGDDAFLPTVRHYTSLMNAYWKSGQPEKAEEILNSMEASTHVQPDAIAYTTVINAWGRSSHRNRATRAWNVLNRMKDAYQDGNVSAMPNVYSYTGVIQACIGLPNRTPDKGVQNMKIALLALSQMDQYDPPNHITFKALLYCVLNLADLKEREKVATTCFSKCCEHGQVDDSVLLMLQRVAPSLYKRTIKTVPSSVDGITTQIPDIPEQWRRNVNVCRNS